MVAIVTGNGNGLERGSLSVLGAAGKIGNAGLGRGGQDVYVNAATGVLTVQHMDEFLVGRGPDAGHGLTYNSTGIVGNVWTQSYHRGLANLPATPNSAGSTIVRRDGDGGSATYTYDSARGVYLTTDGGGAHDELRYASGVWTWTDGDSRTTETYVALSGVPGYQIVSAVTDADGNTQTYAWNSNATPQRITNANGDYIEFGLDNGLPTYSTTYNSSGAAMLTRARYAWDSLRRLTSVTIDLTPGDQVIADGNVYRIDYEYHGSTERLSAIIQTDGSRLDIAYDSSGRVLSLTELAAAGATRVTSFSYDTTNRITTVTDPNLQPTQLWYDTQFRLTKIVSPPATTGAAAQTQLFAYNSAGDVTSVTDPAGNATTFQYDSSGNQIWRQDRLGNVVTRTYGAKNELLTESHHAGGALSFTTSGMTPTVTGNKIVSATGGPWGNAVTDQSYTGTAYVSGRRYHPENGYTFIGLADGPLNLGAPYNDYDYSYYIYEDGFRIWENGSQIDVPVPSGATDSHLLEIEYDGSKVIYRIGGNVVREVATTAGRTFRGAVSVLLYDRGVQDFTFAAQAPETTRFVYDAENHLRYAIGAEGGVTEYRYNNVGQRVAELVYSESYYNVSGLSGSTAITEATLNAWVSALADKSTVKRTNTFYDARGQVSSVVSYSALSPFGEGSESPLAITPGANATVTEQPDGLYRITKTSGTSSIWDADAHSALKVEGDFVLRLRPGQANKHVIGGMATKPGANASYTNLDYGFYFVAGGPLHYMEQGVWQSLGVTYTTGDNLWLARVGTTISYYKGATYEAAVAAGALRTRAGAGEILYFDSSLYESDATLDVGLTARGIATGVNTTVTQQGDGLYRVTKTSGGALNWDADARGTAKAEGDFVLRLRPSQNNLAMVGGVSAAPGAHASFEVDYGFFFTAAGTAYWMESGYHATLGVNYNAGDNFWLVRTGSTINYYKGATLEAAVAAGSLRTRTSTATFYYDSSFYQTGAAMDVAFTPALIKGWNTSAAPLGDGLQRITKTSGSTANWDGDARSTAKADGDFVLQLRPGQANAHVVGGVSTAPDLHASYENVDFGFYFSSDGYAYRIESGYYSFLAYYAASDNFWLVRTGTTINYYKGATLEAAMAAGSLRTRTGFGGTYYFDSSFYSTGATLDMAFAPAPVAAPSANFSRTDYVYDAAGQLIARMTDGQRPETFAYDGLGRMVAATDRNQGTTNIVFNDAATQTVVTLASGLVTTSTYNKAGDLVSVAQSGSYVTGGTATSKYDKLGRLRMTTDAAGFNKYFVYDKAGRMVAEVNHRGDMIEYRYDSNDRLIATTRYTAGVTAANLTALADPNSTLEASAIRPTWHPWDIWTWRTYDKEGRLTSTMDGTIRTYEYDKAGRLIKTVAYYNPLDWDHAVAFQSNPPSTPYIPATDARDSVARNFYDKEGRLVAALDGEGYLTRNLYDRAGQLVERIAYATATAAADRSAPLARLLANQASHADDRRTRFVYDGQGQLRFEIDALNQVAEHRYNSAGQAISTIRHAGSIPTPADYRLATIKAAVATLAETASAASTRRSWSVYDEAGRLAYAIGGEGAVTRFSYDTMGQVTKTVAYAAVRPTTSAPELVTMDAWAAAQAGNAGNRVTRHYYSARGELRYSVDGEGHVSRTDFDADGRTVAELRWTDPFAVTDSSTIADVAAATNNSTRWAGQWFGYDYGGPLTDFTNGEGNWTRYDYYQNGTQMREFVPYGDGAITYFQYDNFGRLTARFDANATPEGATVSYGRDGLGNQNVFTDARNYSTTRTFDHRGLVLTETDAAGGIVSYEYNAFGEVTKVTDARGNATNSSYDRLGRLLTTTDALSNVTTYTYNEFADLRTVTRGTAVTTFDYDRAGRVIKSIDAEGYYEEYTLNAFGDRTSVRNKIGGVTVNSFDRRGLLVAETLPMASVDVNGNVVAATVTNKFEYDGRGNLTKKIEAFGLAEARTTTYYYDKADRLVETWGDSVLTIDQATHNAQTWVAPSDKLKYDQRGRVIERTDALGARTLYYYDRMNRVSVELGATGTYTAFTYDANGNVLTHRIYGTAVAQPALAGGSPPAAPGGEYRETSYTYDQLNRLKTTSVAGIRIGAWNGSAYATAASQTVTTTLDYDANGNVVRSVDGNNNASFAYYDQENRKIAEVDREGYLTFYTLDGEGNVTQEDRYAAAVVAAIGSIPATLRASAAAAGTVRTTLFEYDRNGRRRFERRLGVEAYSLNGDGTLSGPVTATASIEYAYNGLGEVTRKTEANGDSVDYDYDSAGRLTRERRAGYLDQGGNGVRPTLSYSYNGLNALTRTRQGGEIAGGSDRITTYHYMAGGRLWTMYDANGAYYQYHYDAAGNVLRESYYRYKANNSYTLDSLLYTRDQLGRVTSQGLASWNGTGWDRGDTQKTAYNAYGDVAQRGVNDLWQEQLTYDSAGRLTKSNSDDGVWRYFGYDGAGNRTLTIESGTADLSAYSMDSAITTSLSGGSAIVATIALYDRRGLQVTTYMPSRELSVGDYQALISSRAYNAYGEVTSETDARNNTTYFTYNKMGRLIQKQAPSVAFTTEGGLTSSGPPVEKYYYDISGRMIGSRDANSVYENGSNPNHKVVTRALLAGTGHGGSEALVTYEYHPDGGHLHNAYDVFGDLRISWDEISRRSDMSYDAMGRLIQLTRPNTLVEYYAYDLLGQRTKHWNSFLGSGNVEVTDYDMQGRVMSQTAFGGDVTTTSYAWSAAISTTGLGSFGGWTETVTMANGKVSTEKSDVYGRQTYKSDLGGHVFTFGYDKAGRMTQRAGSETVNFTWFNTGKVSESFTAIGTPGAGPWARKGTTYGYDKAGNLVSEKLVDQGYDTAPWSRTYKNATATYDSHGRLATWTEAGGADMAAATTSYKYDLVGNIRHTLATYTPIDNFGVQSIYPGSQEIWYRYDSLNRLVTKGDLLAGQIVRGESGADYLYNAAGQRTRVVRTAAADAWVSNPEYDPNDRENARDEYIWVSYAQDTREEYYYDLGGALSSVRIAQGGYVDNYDGTATTTAAPAYAQLRASYTNDLMGRVVQQVDWQGDGTDAAYDRTSDYNAKGQVWHELVYQKQGNDTLKTDTTNQFGSGSTYALGAVTSSATYHYKLVSGSYTYQSSSTGSNSYVWYDGAVQSVIGTTNTVQPSTTTTFGYDGSGVLTSIYVADGVRPRNIAFVNDANGQAIRRDEADYNYQLYTGGDPHDLWHRFGGKQMGHVGNNGTLDTDYGTSITNRTIAPTPGQGAFRFGSVGGSAQADFDLSGEAITSYGQGVAAGSYVVRQGDTLETIAAQLWGDSSLWYKLAEANGMSASNGLAEGQRLTVPAGVARNRHNASTFKPYDPTETIGDLTPATPRPKAAKRGKCGIFGQLLLIAVAVAVSVVTAGALSGMSPILIGAISGAAGSIASQTVGLVTGIQDKFSFKGVALAALGGAVGGAIGPKGLFGAKGAFSGVKSGFLQGALRGAASSALTQGIGVAVGLQKKFDFAGVAAAGVGGGITAALAKTPLAKDNSLANHLTHAGAAGASAIGNAAVRSLIDGTNFGDNLIAALPDVIGSTIGNMVAFGVSGTGQGSMVAAHGAIHEHEAAHEASLSGTALVAPGVGIGVAAQPVPGVGGGVVVAPDYSSEDIVITGRRTSVAVDIAASASSAARSIGAGSGPASAYYANGMVQLRTGGNGPLYQTIWSMQPTPGFEKAYADYMTDWGADRFSDQVVSELATLLSSGEGVSDLDFNTDMAKALGTFATILEGHSGSGHAIYGDTAGRLNAEAQLYAAEAKRLSASVQDVKPPSPLPADRPTMRGIVDSYNKTKHMNPHDTGEGMVQVAMALLDFADRKQRGESTRSAAMAVGTLGAAALVGARRRGAGSRSPIWSTTKVRTSVQNAYGHWKSHRKEFPEFQNSKQYVDAARAIAAKPPAGALVKTRGKDTLIYIPKTNTFVVRAPNGAPRTMFKPDPAKHGLPTNLDYFNAQ